MEHQYNGMKKMSEHNHSGMKNMGHEDHDHSAPVEDSEIRNWKKKLIGSWIFAIPVAVLMILMRFLDT